MLNGACLLEPSCWFSRPAVSIPESTGAAHRCCPEDTCLQRLQAQPSPLAHGPSSLLPALAFLRPASWFTLVLSVSCWRGAEEPYHRSPQARLPASLAISNTSSLFDLYHPPGFELNPS